MPREIMEYDDVREKNIDALMRLLMRTNMTLDSRMFAEKLIKKEHHYVTQAIGRNRARLERQTVLDRRENKPEGRSGGRPEVYYQLTERQILILLGALASGEQRDYLYDLLVDAFIRTKERVLELENRHRIIEISETINIEQLLDEKLDEKVQEIKEHLDERVDAIEQKIVENSPKTILKHSFGKAKLSDLK